MANYATLQRILVRRIKLKRLYNTYKAPKLEKNFDTIIESQAQPQVPNAAPAARRRRNRTRRRRS